MHTHTGKFPIGLRRLAKSPWQRDIPGLLAWAKQRQFELIDLGRDADTCGQQIFDAGFGIGSADLPEWYGMLSRDGGERRAAVERNAAYIRACTALGGAGGERISNFMMVMQPAPAAAGAPEPSRAESFQAMVDSLNDLSPT